ncbi:MAG: endonuclease III [Deltaproteobacteria bacterium]|nr:endonuclease III [Deltaproteobacteria bacterium]
MKKKTRPKKNQIDKNRINKIRKILKDSYPDVRTQLIHGNPFQLLMATILSAQCTDRQVNQVTPKLFDSFPTPEALSKAPIKKVEKLIHSTGFYHNKALNLKRCCSMLVQKHEGKVPSTLEELVLLPGVGRKTANVVLGAAFGIPGMVVDTHVARISKRLGLTKNTNPEKIEYDLMEIIAKKEWNVISLYLIYFGREICRSRNPLCTTCRMLTLCPFPDKNLS